MNWFDECRKEAEALTIEQRQQVMDCVYESKTIGEIMDALHLRMAAVCGVINMNIECVTHKTLRRESL